MTVKNGMPEAMGAGLWLRADPRRLRDLLSAAIVGTAVFVAALLAGSDAAALIAGLLAGFAAVVTAQLLHRRRRQVRQPGGDKSFLNRMFQDSPCAMVLTDLDDNILDVNPAYERLTGYARPELLGMPISMNRTAQFDDEQVHQMREKLQRLGEWEGYFWLRGRNGAAFSDKVIRRLVHNPETGGAGYLTISLDAVGNEEERRLMLWQAHHDTLTKLPNRNLFQERFARGVLNLKPGQRGAILSIDIDNFKIVNQSFGAAMGDQLLTQVGFRIALAVGDTDTVARLGSDLFAVLVESIDDFAQAERLARTLLEQIRMPYEVNGEDVFLTASIGICVYPDEGTDCGELMQRADAARARVKSQGGGDVAFFEAAMNEGAQRRLELENALRKAIRDDQLLLHFQPVIDLRTGGVKGAEALVRWQHPERGLISPGVFIPVAEETGLIVDLGAWVIRRVGRYLKENASPLLRDMRFSVNVSAAQLHDAGNRAALLALLEQEDCARLNLEITESALVADREGVLAFLDAARAWLPDVAG
ncbi:MAG: diguanylate cyclase [Pseudomonadales bacterium]